MQYDAFKFLCFHWSSFSILCKFSPCFQRINTEGESKNKFIWFTILFNSSPIRIFINFNVLRVNSVIIIIYYWDLHLKFTFFTCRDISNLSNTLSLALLLSRERESNKMFWSLHSFFLYCVLCTVQAQHKKFNHANVVVQVPVVSSWLG